MTTVVELVELTSWFMYMNAFPGVGQAYFTVTNLIHSIGKEMKTHNAYGEEKVAVRLERTTACKDFLRYVLSSVRNRPLLFIATSCHTTKSLALLTRKSF